MRVTCLAQEHNTMSPARARTRTVLSEVECTNHEATVPPLQNVYRTSFPYFFGPRLEYVFERSLQLSLHTPKRFNAFQVLKWFLLLLEVTCVIFAYATNADMWQAFVARAN